MSVQHAGVLLVDKPAGITSHDAVQHIRRLDVFSGHKVGHAGTLDPFATGLLPVLVGEATRLQHRLVELAKTYLATAQFGARSTSGDPEGEILSGPGGTSTEAITNALPGFLGEIEQQVPLTSAVKVDGERLYKRAHRGELIETPVRKVTVERLQLQEFDTDKQSAQFLVVCSKGTYVRQLITDIGDLSGAGAYCDALRRTAVGPFDLGQAVTLASLGEGVDLDRLAAWKPMQVSIGDVVLQGPKVNSENRQVT